MSRASGCCLVPVRRFPRPSRSFHFGDVWEAKGRETPRHKQNAHVCFAFLKQKKKPLWISARSTLSDRL